MARILFSKEGNAVWISHLDLMRVLQRSFRRAGMLLKHSQGYTPHPCLSIAMPLSVGVSSRYEIMDFELVEEQTLDYDTIVSQLNAVLPDGVRILHCYKDGRKLKDLKWLEAELTLEYDAGVPADALQQIMALFTAEQLFVDKHSKNGLSEIDVIPMLQSLEVSASDDNTVLLHAVVAAQNPTLNPLLLISAVNRYLPQLTPDFSKCCRLCLYDAEMQKFL